MTNIVGAAFLGVTVGCARCHDHKFDPFRQSDYYRLQAFLRDDLRKGRVSESYTGSGGRMESGVGSGPGRDQGGAGAVVPASR